MDRIKRYAGVIIAAATVMTAAFAMPAGAVTLDWNDLTDAQQENAYKKLESENEDLKKRIKELEGQLGISGETSGESASEGSASTAGSPVRFRRRHKPRRQSRQRREHIDR